MLIKPQCVWSDIQSIKKISPLIHNITNYVVMELTANSLLAIGASPVMAHAEAEVEDMASIANSLVINIGTLSPAWIKAMMLALKAANNKKIPVILDPVGVGATPYRTDTAHTLLKHGPIAVIRGNASEIVSLNGQLGQTKGVDSALNTSDYHEHAKKLALKYNCVVWMSGQKDVITDGKATIYVHNGHPLMRQVTGMGCTASALTGAFLAINQNSLRGTAHAAIMTGIAGEIAAKKCKGPGSFKPLFTDILYNLTLQELEERMRVEGV